jgi:farnesyl-diphosphate farnesyltransferase
VTKVSALLQKTSRTIALAIPLLPEPTGTEVSVASLLFRVIGTFETTTRWPIVRRIEALTAFVELLDGAPEAANGIVGEWVREPPVTHAGHKELLEDVPHVLRAFQHLRRDARTSIRRHIGRSADGLGRFMSRSDGSDDLELGTVEDLRGYCYVVGGIVGEMLTELFLLDRPKLAPVAQALESRAAAFGEGLRLVHILNATKLDRQEGRAYLPRRAEVAEIIALAEDDLAIATTYTDTLRAAGADPGLVAFNAFVTDLAIAKLAMLRDYGPGSRLSRLEIAKIAVEAAQRVSHPRHLVRAPSTGSAVRAAS